MGAGEVCEQLVSLGWQKKRQHDDKEDTTTCHVAEADASCPGPVGDPGAGGGGVAGDAGGPVGRARVGVETRWTWTLGAGDHGC